MKRSLLYLALAFFILPLFYGTGLCFQSDKPMVSVEAQNCVPGELIVKFRTDDSGTAKALHAKNGLKKKERLFQDIGRSSLKAKLAQQGRSRDAINRIINLEESLSRIYKLSFDKKADIAKLVTAYASDPDVEYAQPNYIYSAQWSPNDYYFNTDLQSLPVYSWGQVYPDMWGLKKIECQTAWDYSQGQEVIVAVIDSGVDYTHQDLAANIWINSDEIAGNGIDDDGNSYIDDVRGWDFANSDKDPIDDHGHGTHCAGTIAAVGNNTIGVVGVAPLAKIMPVKFLKSDGFGSSATGALCIRYAAANGANVLSNSWGAGGVSSDPTIEDAIDYAMSLGCVVVCAAGNDSGLVANHSPANYPRTIAVASVDYQDVKASTSNYGPGIDISAPGVEILSLRANGTDMYGNGSHTIGTYYMRASGTSMACPHVSGAAALLFAAHPDWTNTQVEEWLKGSSDSIDDKNPNYQGALGTGRLNVMKALSPNPTPSLHISRYDIISDTGGNPNGLLNPGETITLSVEIRNYWVDAVNTQAVLSSSSPYITVSQANASYGTVSQGSVKSGSFVFTVSNSAAPGQVIQFSLSLLADGGYSVTRQFGMTIAKPARYGWPKGTWTRGMTPVDMNGDGQKEIVALYDWSRIMIYNADSTPFNSNWPKDFKLGACDRYWNPSFGDVNGDGNTEIVLVGHRNDITDVKYIHVVDLNGNELPGWPKAFSQVYDMGQAAIADIDPAVPGLEIVVPVPQYDPVARKSYGNLCVFKHDGQALPNFPLYYPSGSCGSFLHDNSGLAVADLDADGNPEIIFSSRDTSYAYLHAVDKSGKDKPGWPRIYGTDYSTNGIAVADLDNNGSLEVVALTYSVGVFGKDSVIIYDSVGNITAQAVYPCGGGGIALADLDGDADLEILFGVGYEGSSIYAIHHNGMLVTGWPVSTGGYYAAVGAVGDLDGDGDLEVTGSCETRVSAWHHNGSPVIGAYPLAQASTSPPHNVSADWYFCFTSMADLDNNKKIQILGGIFDTGGYAFVWDFTPSWFAIDIAWPMSGFDPQRTNHKPAAAALKMVIEPTSAIRFTGPVSGPFVAAPTSAFQLTNTSTTTMQWKATLSKTWFTLTPSSGTLSPGQSTTVSVSTTPSVNNMGMGEYSDTILFRNSEDGPVIRRALNLSIKSPTLSITPNTSCYSYGFTGGPFEPESYTYELKNTGHGSLSWTAARSMDIVNLSQTAGTLAPGASVLVTVTINSNAKSLVDGVYQPVVTFINTTNGLGTTTRTIYLTVGKLRIVHVNKLAESTVHDGKSWGTGFLSIQSGIDAAGVGQEVWVTSGQYSSSVTLKNGVVLRGGYKGLGSTRDIKNSPTTITTTVTGANSATLDGFTISGTLTNGISLSSGSMTIINNTVTGSITNGIYLAGASGLIANNTLQNKIPSGECFGIYCVLNSSPVIDSNKFITSLRGIVVHDNSTPTITNNLIDGVWLGIYSYGASPKIINNTIVNTTGWGIACTESVSTISNNIVAYNSIGVSVRNYSGGHYGILTNNNVYGNTTNYEGTGPGTGGISEDPLFVSKQNKDYRLQPGSPCIDKANPSTATMKDYIGTARPLDGDTDGVSAADMGCYEYAKPFNTLAQAKSLADGTRIALDGLVCTAALPGRFYLESSDRTQGIGVLGASSTSGKTALVEGTLFTVDGERVINAYNTIEGAAGTIPSPFLMTTQSLGGGPCGLQTGLKAYQNILKDGTWQRALLDCGGANNIGLLVKVVGRVTSSGVDYFYMDDCKKSDDGCGIPGVKVDWPFASVKPASGLLEVTGISSCYINNGNTVRLLRPVSPEAVRVLGP